MNPSQEPNHASIVLANGGNPQRCVYSSANLRQRMAYHQWKFLHEAFLWALPVANGRGWTIHLELAN